MRSIEEATLEEHERAALKAMAQVLREHFPATDIMLFGARARGEGDVESDLDLLALTARPVSWRERQPLVDALFDIELEYDVVLSPLVAEDDAWRHGVYSGAKWTAIPEQSGH